MRYYFHVIRNNAILYDPHGEEVADRTSLRDRAARYVRQIASEELRNGRPIPMRWRLHVTAADFEVEAHETFATLLTA